MAVFIIHITTRLAFVDQLWFTDEDDIVSPLDFHLTNYWVTNSCQSMYNPDFSQPWHFSDVVLIVEGIKFHVHKSTLSMWSPVFEKMFTSDFAEKDAKEIELPGKTAREIEVLLNIVYTHGRRQRITAENYQFLLELGEEYQMERVKELCYEYLSSNVQDTNCVKFYMIANKFGLEPLMKESLQESKYLSLGSLENDECFKELPDKTKIEILKARILELERTLGDYVNTCSTLVTSIYRRVAEKVQTTECDNYEVHRCGATERFKLSCKCCRRRVQYANCEVEYWDFRTLLKKLFDLENCNRTARQFKHPTS